MCLGTETTRECVLLSTRIRMRHHFDTMITVFVIGEILNLFIDRGLMSHFIFYSVFYVDSILVCLIPHNLITC